MKPVRWMPALVLLLAPLAFAQGASVRAVLEASEQAWNAGDLETFVSYYEDSPETTFIGAEITRGGRAAILERYRRRYPNREAMGVLTFSEIQVRPLTANLAIVTGRFHLERSAAGGGEASGRYTLVMRRSAAGWKIIHDHTS